MGELWRGVSKFENIKRRETGKLYQSQLPCQNMMASVGGDRGEERHSNKVNACRE